MIKFLCKLVLTVLLLNIVNVSAEELLDDRHMFNPYDNPVYYKYFDDYINILGENFDRIKFYRINIFVGFKYKIYRDGSIHDIKIDYLTNSPMNAKKLQKLIESNLPPKFYDGMNKDYVNVDLVFATNQYYDEYELDKFPPRVVKDGIFKILIDKKI